MTPEEYAKMHQKAFRVAFDFLNAHFPPGSDDEWWLRSARELADTSVAAGENKLVIELLNGVFSYLSDECKRREE